MNENKNKNTFSIFKIIIVIDIITISLIIFSLIYNNRKSDNLKTDEANIYSYKNFNFNIPDDVKFDFLTDDQFKLSGNDWRATIEIFINYNDAILNKPKKYYQLLIENGNDVSAYEKRVINKETVIIYKNKNKGDANFCYFKTFSPYWYEIILYDDKDTFNEDALVKVVNILSNGKYNKESSVNYSYNELIMN